MEKQMEYILLPSLEHMALLKVTIALWNKYDMYLISKLVLMEAEEKEEKWQDIEKNVLHKVKKLFLPESFKEKISCFVKPIGLEIRQWVEYNKDLFLNDNSSKMELRSAKKQGKGKDKISEVSIIRDKLYWNSQGTVNGKKTAEALITEQKLNVKKHFFLACDNCCEDEIFELWYKMSERDRKNFYSKEGPENVQQPYLVLYWTYVIKGEVGRLCRLKDIIDIGDPPYDGLVNSIKLGNLEATKYFFPKITSEERENLEEIIYYTATLPDDFLDYSCDVVWFLFSQMKDQQLIMSYYVLDFLLKWPCQPLFMTMAKCVYNHLQQDETYHLLLKMGSIVVEGYTDFDYETLFLEFWQLIPKATKKYIIRQCTTNTVFLVNLLSFKNKVLYLVLEEATAEDCVEIFRYGKMHSRGELLYKDEFYSRPFLLQVFVMSVSKNIDEFVEEFRHNILSQRPKDSIEEEKETWDDLFQYVDNWFHRNSKRTTGDAESGSVKRRRSSRLRRLVNE